MCGGSHRRTTDGAKKPLGRQIIHKRFIYLHNNTSGLRADIRHKSHIVSWLRTWHRITSSIPMSTRLYAPLMETIDFNNNNEYNYNIIYRNGRRRRCRALFIDLLYNIICLPRFASYDASAFNQKGNERF